MNTAPVSKMSGPHTTRQEGSFFGKQRKYTRHIRPEDELDSDVAAHEDLDFLFLKAPADHVPIVDSSVRTNLRKTNPTDTIHYEDLFEAYQYDDMPSTSKEVLQFTQDLTSKEFADALSKKLHKKQPLDELYLAEDPDHNTEDLPVVLPKDDSVKKKSKNKRRKERRAAQRSQIQFRNSVPKIPARFDHFFYIQKDSVEQFRARPDVTECWDQLSPYLYLSREDWTEKRFSLEDLEMVVQHIGFFPLKTHRRVEGKYTVLVYTDIKQDSDSQALVYDIALFVVCGRLKNHGCYFLFTFFFMKNT